MDLRKTAVLWKGAVTALFLCGCQSEKISQPSPVKPPSFEAAPAQGAGKSSSVRPDALPAADKERSANYRRALLFVQTMEMLQKNYVDGKKVTSEELFNHAMRGMVSALDPYSDYEPPREHRHQQVKRTGMVVGIGATAVKPDGRPISLIRILPGTPAERAKLQPGDQIIAIDGVNVLKLNLARALDKLRGRPGTVVKLQLRRGKKDFNLEIKRELVKNKSIVPGSVKLISGKIGYIKLSSFDLSSDREFQESLQKLHKLGAQGIILDLRYNPGGIVSTAVSIASMLLGDDKVVFRATSRNKSHEQTVKTLKGKAVDTKTPLVVLTNAFSASCSEILTGARQDHKRARVLGVRTFGKGTILRVVPVKGGGAVRYASAYYVTPGGRVIEAKGIIPDIEVRIPSDDVMRLSTQTLRYPGAIKAPHRGTLQDLQLRKAVELLQSELKSKEAKL